MALFDGKYKTAAATEIERNIRRLKDMGFLEQVKNSGIKYDAVTADIGTQIRFAKRIDLITAKQRDEYVSRIIQAQKDYDRLQREEIRDIVDGFENPRERAARYLSKDEWAGHVQAAKEQAAQNISGNANTQQAQVFQSPFDDRSERGGGGS